MKYSSSRTSADRHGNGMSRGVMEDVDDTKLMQETHLSLFKDEQQQGIERFVQYGFTGVPQKPSFKNGVKMAAEAIMSYMGGGRSHGIAMILGDRRFRLYKLENGEVALHDDQGHQVHLARDGIYASAPNSKKIVMQIMQSDDMPNSDKQAKGGQTAQKKETAVGTITMDKDSITYDHPNANITYNCKTFNVNASSDIKLISATNALLKGASAILYATANAFLKAAGSINAKAGSNLADPPWVDGAADPPISS